MGDGFNPYEQNTVGANWHLHSEDIGAQRIELQIWDTAGQERYRSLGPLYYRSAVAALAVYDVTNRTSFRNVPPWIDAVSQTAGSDIIFFVIGNKIDLEDERQVSYEEGQDYAREMNYEFFETSAKIVDGIRPMFRQLAEKVAALQFKKTVHGVTVGDPSGGSCC
jgi:small GTP-binding protein